MRNLVLLILALCMLTVTKSNAQKKAKEVKLTKTIILNDQDTSISTMVSIDGKSEIIDENVLEYEIIKDGDSVLVQISGEYESSDEVEVKKKKQIVVSMDMGEEIPEIEFDETSDSEKIIVKTVELRSEENEVGDMQVYCISNAEEGIKMKVVIKSLSDDDLTDFELPETYLENKTDKDLVEFYPNPNNGVFKLKLNTDKEETCILKIYDEAGRIIYNKKLVSYSDSIEENVDISKFGVGTYVLAIEKRDGTIIKKIIVN